MKNCLVFAALVMVMSGCKARTDTAADTATADSVMMAVANDSMAMASDPDSAAKGGTGVPAGYMGRTDRDNQNIADVKYKEDNGRWHIWTGPHHIVYASKDAASGTYTLTATIDQMEAPQHPESFGVIFGGSNLDQPGIKYSYFMVRGTGEYLVKTRDGADTKNVVAWKAADGIPKADASGKASYKLGVKVGTDSVRFLVNEKQVGSVAKSAVTTDGIAGIRVGHNLHVLATPVTVAKGK